MRSCCFALPGVHPPSLRHRPGEDAPCRDVRIQLTAEWSGHALVRYRAGPWTGAAGAEKWKSVWSIHMRWRTTASFLASATFAHFRPRRLAIFIAQTFRTGHFADLTIMTWAASKRATRTEASPARLIEPTRSVSPDWYRRGVRANDAPTDFVEAPWVVDRSPVGQRYDRADARNAHQPLTNGILARGAKHSLIDDCDLVAKSCSGNLERLHDRYQSWMPGDRFTYFCVPSPA